MKGSGKADNQTDLGDIIVGSVPSARLQLDRKSPGVEIEVSSQAVDRINWLIQNSSPAVSDILREVLDVERPLRLDRLYELRQRRLRFASPKNSLFARLEYLCSPSGSDAVVESSRPRHDLLILLSGWLGPDALQRGISEAIANARADLSPELVEFYQQFPPDLSDYGDENRQPRIEEIVNSLLAEVRLLDVEKISKDYSGLCRRDYEYQGRHLREAIRSVVIAVINRNDANRLEERLLLSLDIEGVDLALNEEVKEGFRSDWNQLGKIICDKNMFETAQRLRGWLGAASSELAFVDLLKYLRENILSTKNCQIPKQSEALILSDRVCGHSSEKIATASPADYLFNGVLNEMLPRHLRSGSAVAQR